MIGRINTAFREATVIGGGIAGLLAAYYLDQAGYEVTLIEKSERLGGLISTRDTPYGISEAAAHSLLASPQVIRLCADLGLKRLEVKPASRARFILRNGKMRRFPLNFGETACLLKRAIFATAHASDQTMEQWCLAHLGEGALEYLLSPFLLGIYGARPSEVSVQAAFPAFALQPGQTLFWNLLSRKIKGQGAPKPPMIAFEGGMGTFVEAIGQHLAERLGSRLRLSEKMDSLPDSTNIVLATPDGEAARLLKTQDPRLSESLTQIEYCSLISCTVFARRSSHQVPQGVGVLIPEKEKRRILGVLFNSSAFEGRVKDESGICSYTVFMGGSLRPHMLMDSDDEIKKTIYDELQDLLKLDAPLEHIEIHRWKQAIPKYSHELGRVWAIAREGWAFTAGHVLFGNYSGHVSLRGMIESASLLKNARP